MSKRSESQALRILIVEDSRTQRELLVRLLESTGKFEIVGTAVNGQDGVEAAQKLRPDIIAMDIHLPILDGYEATRQIMQTCPTPIVMVSNSLGDEGRRSVEAMASGALAVIRKPGNMRNDAYELDRVNLVRTLQLMADVPVVTRHPPRPPRPQVVQAERTPHAKVLAIAASTGGPAAIQIVLSGLGKNFPLPILLVQHIASGFVEALADWLNTILPLNICVAKHGQPMQPGHVYLAPDDHHLLVKQYGTIGLQQSIPEDRYCPSADILFDAVAQIYGAQSIGVILTGMGDDGAQGLRAMRIQGSQTYAQDEASCVVYGMPQAAVAAGAIVRVLPLERIAPAILQYIGSDIVATTGG